MEGPSNSTEELSQYGERVGRAGRVLHNQQGVHLRDEIWVIPNLFHIKHFCLINKQATKSSTV